MISPSTSSKVLKQSKNNKKYHAKSGTQEMHRYMLKVNPQPEQTPEEAKRRYQVLCLCETTMANMWPIGDNPNMMDRYEFWNNLPAHDVVILQNKFVKLLARYAEKSSPNKTKQVVGGAENA